MLLRVSNIHKSIGLKDLFDGLSFNVEKGERVALIGRNGLGKTTLFRMLTGEDKEYSGEIEFLKNISVIMTRQEHFLHQDVTPVDYILNDVPEYRDLQYAIREYEENQSADVEAITKYSDAVMKFSELGYYSIEDQIVQSLNDFEIDIEMALGSFNSLSGGQKRFVELVRVMFSGADIALIDEPTNHMDYVGKDAFIKWLGDTEQTIFVITHDRDVLKKVDRILELKDKNVVSFSGNYDDFIRRNNESTSAQINHYELDLKRIDTSKKQMLLARTQKMTAKSNKARTAALIRERRFQREFEKLNENLEKPSFWIDQESIETIDKEVVEKYEKYKEKNITVRATGSAEKHKKLLMKMDRLSIGYGYPLFSNLSFELYNYDRMFIKGRNGAGKSTLVKTIIRLMDEFIEKEYGKNPRTKEKFNTSSANIYFGDYKFSPKISYGVYEQEVDPKYLEMSLSEAIFTVYNEQDIPINAQGVKNLMGQYLFDPQLDANLTFKNLSGGQKARFQIIKMLSNKPNLLILDEPTNHLDLPSIEELENALQNFSGAIIYITHDTYLVQKLGGRIVEI